MLDMTCRAVYLCNKILRFYYTTVYFRAMKTIENTVGKVRLGVYTILLLFYSLISIYVLQAGLQQCLIKLYT